MSNVRLPIVQPSVPVGAPGVPREQAESTALSGLELGEHRTISGGAPPPAEASSRTRMSALIDAKAHPAAAEEGADGAPGELMQVGDLARESGKTVRAIHLYEQLDLLRPLARSKGRYRLYGPEALLRIRWIGKLQELGLSLPDIKAIVKDVETQGSAPSAMDKVRDVYREKLAETRAQIERLASLEKEMLASLEYLEACKSVCEPGRLVEACQSCDHHPREQHVPDLVAGFRA